MSKLSEILGVPEGGEFKYEECTGKFKVTGNFLVHKNVHLTNWDIVTGGLEYEMIAYPEKVKIIEEKSNLTDQQITAIKGRIAEGTPWAARNKYSDNTIYFFPNKPRTNSAKTSWHAIERTDLVFVTVGSNKNNLYDFITFDNSPVYLPDLIEG